MQYRKMSFIGAGNMACAIITGLVKAGYPAPLISLCAPSATKRDALANQFGVISSDDNISSAKDADVLVLAVKPQVMAEVCQPLGSVVDFSKKLILSMAAGITVARFNALLEDKLNLIRMMPNSPAMVGKGMTGLFAPDHVSAQDRHFASALMKTVGNVCWLDSEDGINAMTAVAGSAPAYFFRFMEAMQQEAQYLGVVQQTAAGAAALVEGYPDVPLSTLHAQVTSTGGTTAEAMRVFDEKRLTDIISHAMKAVMTRAREMEKRF